MKLHRFIVPVAAMLLASACDKTSSSSGATVVPGEPQAAPGTDPEGTQEGDSMGELQLRLRRLVEEQSTKLEPAATDAAVCEDLCSLATSICGVQQKLCDLADRHAGDDRYQGLCREARLECKEAQNACIQCVQRHSSQP